MIEEEATSEGELPKREWIDSGMTSPSNREQITTWIISFPEDTEETQVCYLTLYAICGDDQGFSLELLK